MSSDTELKSLTAQLQGLATIQPANPTYTLTVDNLSLSNVSFCLYPVLSDIILSMNN